MDERRATPLARQLADEIAAGGPIGLDRYMSRCLSDPEHGYYRTRSAIGSGGDFTTAPEISQVFGELIGLWAAVVWQQMGSPARVNVVELGPGRGVLLDDALRAASIVPGFLDAIEVHLCEINPALRDAQQARLAASGIKAAWHDDLATVPQAPTIVIANEFLDTMPGRQWRLGCDGRWREIGVGVGEGQLAFVEIDGGGALSADAGLAELWPADLWPADLWPADALPVGATASSVLTIVDYGPIAAELARLGQCAPLAGLFIDYGHAESAYGDTLQAVRRHRYEHPLASPGEADLSIAVDFRAFQRAVQAHGLGSDGPVYQASFLGQLGIAERASRLMAARPDRAGEIEAAVARLLGVPGMGSRFLAIGVRSEGIAALPGLASAGDIAASSGL